jgi:hypothetical protein
MASSIAATTSAPGRRAAASSARTHTPVTAPLTASTAADALLVPLEVPPDARARAAEGIAATTARLAAALDRFEGLHILVFEVPDADVVARMRGAGGVPLGFIEIDEGGSPEGRLAAAEPLGEGAVDHPNGAVDLVGPVLCVGDDDLAAVEGRYERYVGRTATPRGPARVFDIDGAEVVLVPARAVDDPLPGERPAALPSFVASVVTVLDLGATAGLLERAGVPVRKSAAGSWSFRRPRPSGRRSSSGRRSYCGSTSAGNTASTSTPTSHPGTGRLCTSSANRLGRAGLRSSGAPIAPCRAAAARDTCLMCRGRRGVASAGPPARGGLRRTT